MTRPQSGASSSDPRALFRSEALRSYALARRGVGLTSLALPRSRTFVLWLLVGLLLAGLVALTVQVEIGSRPLFSLLPGLDGPRGAP